jgi:hypothetical protein
MEGNPLSGKREQPKQTEGPELPQSPEYWVPRQELPFSRDYIGLQVKVAQEVANRLKLPLSQVVDNYTTIFHSYIWPDTENYLDIDHMTENELTNAIYEKEKAHSEKQQPTEYHKGNRYGCFAYFPHTGGTGEELKGRVDIHFANAELDETGPLDREKIDRRLAELKEMFTQIKKTIPEAKFVRGDSWLYNIEAYKRLFPESYIGNAEIDTSPAALATGRTWGQFSDSHLELKEDLAKQFLKNIKELEEVTPEAVREALPLQALTVTAPIEDFYKKYGIE